MERLLKQKTLVILILGALICVNTSFANNYGLSFNNNNNQSVRTGFELTENDPFKFKNQFDIEFKFKLINNVNGAFGYIASLKFENDQIVDIILFRKDAAIYSINVVHRDQKMIEYHTTQSELRRSWGNYKLNFNLQDKAFTFTLNGQLISQSKLPDGIKGDKVKILFGADNTRFLDGVDVPPVEIKDIKLYSNEKLKQWWPLDEATGSEVKDKLTGTSVKVLNPHWLYSVYLDWDLVVEKKWPGRAQISVSNKSDNIMLIGEDSIIFRGIYQKSNSVRYADDQKHFIAYEGNIFFDTLTKKLGSFNLIHKAASFYNFNTNKWANEKDLREKKHDYFFKNNIVCPIDTSLYIFNGYRNFRYTNSVWKYHINSDTWDSITTKGDIPSPRSLAAMGSNNTGDTLYILGGFGSETGEQILNPQFYHDLYYYSVKDSSFGLIYNYDSLGLDYTFAESMIVDSKNQMFYALVLADSSLQLVGGSLKKPGFRLFGYKIPYLYNRADTYQDLFFLKKTNKLVCSIIQRANDSSTVQLFAINFPPNEIFNKELKNEDKSKLYIILAIVLFGLAIIAFVIKRRKKSSPAINSERQLHYSQLKINTKPQRSDQATAISESYDLKILVFGTFRILNKQGDNYSTKFSPLLQELFLLIFLKSVKGESVSKTEISQTLWPDKATDSVRNNRAVNLAKLKKLIEEIEGIDLIKEGDAWKIELYDKVYSDYFHFLHFIEDNNEIDMHDINELLGITKSGSFLSDIQSDWMEENRSNIIYKLIDYYTAILQSLEVSNNAELIIEIADSIIKFDLINEEALSYKCKALISLGRQGLAKTAYNNFLKDYQELYNETYEVSLKELLDEEEL